MHEHQRGQVAVGFQLGTQPVAPPGAEAAAVTARLQRIEQNDVKAIALDRGLSASPRSVMSPVQISMSGVLGWRISRSSVARKRVRLSSSGLASGSNPM
jgi:hypothetical protein